MNEFATEIHDYVKDRVPEAVSHRIQPGMSLKVPVEYAEEISKFLQLTIPSSRSGRLIPGRQTDLELVIGDENRPPWFFYIPPGVETYYNLDLYELEDEDGDT